jgi:hypothetical protein
MINLNAPGIRTMTRRNGAGRCSWLGFCVRVCVMVARELAGGAWLFSQEVGVLSGFNKLDIAIII